MASANDKYEIKVIHGNGGPTGDRQAKKLLREGWELVNDKGGFLMSGRTRTYRRPKPDFAPDAESANAQIAPEPRDGSVELEAQQTAAQIELNDAQRELAEARAEFYRIKAKKAAEREARKQSKDAKRAAKVEAKAEKVQRSSR